VALVRLSGVHIIHAIVCMTMFLVEALMLASYIYVYKNCGSFWFCYGMAPSGTTASTKACVEFIVSMAVVSYMMLDCLAQMAVSYIISEEYAKVDVEERVNGVVKIGAPVQQYNTYAPILNPRKNKTK
jgi:hypothetical protein